MSETYEKVQEAVKSAMKAGDAMKRDILRMVVSDIKNKTVNEGKSITEDIVVSCLKKAAKQIEDSIESARMAVRADLEEKSRKELAIVSEFLPSMASEAEMLDILRSVIAKNEESLGRSMSKKDFGSLMKLLPSSCDKKFCAKALQGMLK